MDDEPTPSERQAMRSYRSDSSSSTPTSKRSSRRHGIFSRKAYRDPVVSAKARISFAFGVTLLVALIIYLVLAGTGVAENTMFHVISILFLLTLTGIFVHQLLHADMQEVILEPDDSVLVNLPNPSSSQRSRFQYTWLLTQASAQMWKLSQLFNNLRLCTETFEPA
ncbi:hypothetical protein A1O7_00981 [Cladophialophora yegresii CBS 114405]|uniref:Uncharacterized protein n=1 Tax=Cladophialophora yegresii CBS 114405 TaxID=1182544 RepID=W9W9M6_9EURO|nr:uncharacterized protein A1O7_00981 [Cladophialophora yegresii CBS 114405]EXJ64643.1 hypothetical protein A1O7_00981 [Cladophialophora yegresii CBS 114405]